MMNCKIDRQLLSLLLAFFVTVSSYAETKRAPYSMKFQDYLECEGSWEGFVPNPMCVNYNGSELRSGQLLPEVFDLRSIEDENFISSIKNQGSYGTCWSFATLAALESVWSRYGLGDYQLSVRNMTNCHGFELASTQGGNHQMATSYLTRLSGPVPENADPYTDMSEQSCRKIEQSTIPYMVTAAYYTDKNINAIKQLVYKYGGVAASMSASTLSQYINATDATYYFDGQAPINHAVTIVGWNDTLTVNGGLAGAAPNKGAWIVKNAYGTRFGDEGYFYASYDDANLGSDNVCYPEAIDKNDVDTLFMYDKLGPTSSRGYVVNGSGEVGYALVKYQLDKPWFINRIGLFFNSGKGYADIYIGTSFNGTTLQDTIAAKQHCFIAYPGYHSFEMPALMDAGDLYILVRYNTPDFSYPIPIESRIPNYCEPQIETSGCQWISYNGTRWDAVGSDTDSNFDLCIRAYGREPKDKVIAYFEAIKTNCCKGDTAKLEYFVQGNPDSLIWTLNNSDTTCVVKRANGEEAPRWVLEKNGFYSVSLVAYNKISADTITQNNCIVVTGAPSLVTMLSKNTEYVAKGKPLTISAEGAERYEWSRYTNSNDTFWGNALTYLPVHDSSYVKVCGYLGSCTVLDSVLVRSIEVDYDDVENAYPLSYNKLEGPFSNYYATVEDGEPAPDQGNCEDQEHWCKEGGLHNSIWFSFEGPESGQVTIESFGYDNQLALYEVLGRNEAWHYLLSNDESKYKLLAANDDANSDFSAALYDVGGLEPGKRYYLQMDGSAGGTMGEATVKLSTSIVASVTENKPFSVNLESNILVVDAVLNNDTKGQVKLFDALGRLCEFRDLKHGASYVRCTLERQTFYLVQVVIGEDVYTEKIVVQ